MATLKENINNIRNAIYGKDVRESIAGAIEHIMVELSADSYGDDVKTLIPELIAEEFADITDGELNADSDNPVANSAVTKEMTKLAMRVTNNEAILSEMPDPETIIKDYVRNIHIDLVKDYGADNTGATAVSDRLQNAINNLGATGGEIYLKNGTYLFDKIVYVTSNIHIIGDTNTVLKSKADSHSIFFFCSKAVGDTTATGYNGFKNVSFKNLTFDLGGEWNFDKTTKQLTYRAKYKDGSGFNGYFSYCPIRASHGDGLSFYNCEFKNGIYGGYTGNNGTNPHIFDVDSIKNLLIDNCTFGTCFCTTVAISNWLGGNTGDSGQPAAQLCDYIQLDCSYGDGAPSPGKGQLDGTICRDIVIRNSKFCGLPHFDKTTVVNNTGDGDKLLYNDTKDYRKFRFAPQSAVGCCHNSATDAYMPQNVEIYNCYFEGEWSSHYDGFNQAASYSALLKNSDYREPARSFCHGVIFANRGAKNYRIHNNVFRETVDYMHNKTTAVTLYGNGENQSGIFCDNIIIDYGEPIMEGYKWENQQSNTPVKTWFAKNQYYDGRAYLRASNNLWIKGDYGSEIIEKRAKGTLAKKQIALVTAPGASYSNPTGAISLSKTVMEASNNTTTVGDYGAAVQQVFDAAFEPDIILIGIGVDAYLINQSSIATMISAMQSLTDTVDAYTEKTPTVIWAIDPTPNEALRTDGIPYIEFVHAVHEFAYKNNQEVIDIGRRCALVYGINGFTGGGYYYPTQSTYNSVVVPFLEKEIMHILKKR